MRTFFFDLDGTLADSRAGLLGAFRAGIAAIDGPDLPETVLEGFIGNPLPKIFRSVRPGADQGQIDIGIAAFRRHYEADGIFQNTLYQGTTGMLATLCDSGAEAWIVTSKPQRHAVLVAEQLGLNAYVTGIVGAGLDETDTKTSLVATALSKAGARASDTVMLGDRHYDVTGALENGVLPVGALWGYGTRAELSQAGCTDFVETPSAFAARFEAAGSLADAARYPQHLSPPWPQRAN